MVVGMLGIRMVQWEGSSEAVGGCEGAYSCGVVLALGVTRGNSWAVVMLGEVGGDATHSGRGNGVFLDDIVGGRVGEQSVSVAGEASDVSSSYDDAFRLAAAATFVSA